MSVVAPDVSTSRKVAFLSSPNAWPDAPTEVQTIETRTSWLFFSGRTVRKLKKPIREGSLDLLTLGARERNCRDAVTLNQRLTEGVYLGCYPLFMRDDGEFCFYGPGTIVDWFVCMRCLDQARMLDRMIEASEVRRNDVDALAAVFTRFYAGRAPVYMSADERLRGLRARFVLARATLEHGGFDLPQEEIGSICHTIDTVLGSPPRWLSDRLRERRTVDGHGDLRPEHICLEKPTAIIDCLEFDRTLRLIDPFEELAGLRMECERLGARWIGDRVIERCAIALSDGIPVELLAFHAAMQACLRARLALLQMPQSLAREPHSQGTRVGGRKSGHWFLQAQGYLALARRSLEELERSTVEC